MVRKKSATVKSKQTSVKATVKVSAGSNKKPSGKNIGKKVKTKTGRIVGRLGVIVRQDTYLGTYFITFNDYQNDPAYKNLEWGPYFESQLEFLKK